MQTNETLLWQTNVPESIEAQIEQFACEQATQAIIEAVAELDLWLSSDNDGSVIFEVWVPDSEVKKKFSLNEVQLLSDMGADKEPFITALERLIERVKAGE